MNDWSEGKHQLGFQGEVRRESGRRTTQNRRISLSDLPLGSKSDPPFPPPMWSPVRAFLNVCSNPRNLRILRLTEG